MKRILLTAFAVLGVMGTAGADPIDLPLDTPVYFQFNNLEQVNTANNLVVPGYAPATGTQGNWGVFNISSIQEGGIATPHVDISGGTAFFADLGALPHPQVTGIFYGIQIDPLDPTRASGGFIDLFWNDAGTITAACLNGGCAPNAATVAQFTSGDFLARIAFASGIDSADAGTFIKSNTDPSTLGGSGHADSFGNVDLSAGGAWAAALDGNWFTTNFGDRDIRFSNFYNFLAAWGDGTGGTVGLRSNDPGRVFTAAPEPATLALLGLGLGLVGARMRRRTNS